MLIKTSKIEFLSLFKLSTVIKIRIPHVKVKKTSMSFSKALTSHHISLRKMLNSDLMKTLVRDLSSPLTDNTLSFHLTEVFI
jgi:hypothetical protein